MHRADLLDHLRRTHFESGDRGLAVADARCIAGLLPAEVESGLANLDKLEREFADRPRAETSFALRARGSILHDFYNGVERIFTFLARELNGGVPQAQQWHQQLLDDMKLAVPQQP